MNSHLGCVMLNCYTTYAPESSDERNGKLDVLVSTEPSPDKAIPVLIVVWLGLWEEPYRSCVTFSSPDAEIHRVRIDKLRLLSVGDPEEDLLSTEPVPLGNWIDLGRPGLKGPMGEIIPGVSLPLPLPSRPLAWLRKKPVTKAATVGPFFWRTNGRRLENVRLTIQYTISGRYGNVTEEREIQMIRKGRLSLHLVILTD